MVRFDPWRKGLCDKNKNEKHKNKNNTCGQVSLLSVFFMTKKKKK